MPQQAGPHCLPDSSWSRIAIGVNAMAGRQGAAAALVIVFVIVTVIVGYVRSDQEPAATIARP